jgi:hypothetical protein
MVSPDFILLFPVYSVLINYSDYNYKPTPDNRCEPIDGLEPQDHLAACKADPNLKTYYVAQGYRKIAISACEGNEEKWLGKPIPCPGHENDDLDEPSGRGLSGFGFFIIAILLPILAAAGIGYLVWTRIQSGGFGRIRLGDSSGVSALDADRPWVKYPVAVLSGLVAVLATVPLLVGAGWRSLSNRFGGSRRYTSRSSFARGRGDYAIVDPDEDELLGDDDEEA